MYTKKAWSYLWKTSQKLWQDLKFVLKVEESDPKLGFLLFLVYWSKYAKKMYWYYFIFIKIVRPVIIKIMKTPQSEYACQSSGISIFHRINKMLLQLFKLLNYLNSLRYEVTPSPWSSPSSPFSGLPSTWPSPSSPELHSWREMYSDMFWTKCFHRVKCVI